MHISGILLTFQSAANNSKQTRLVREIRTTVGVTGSPPHPLESASNVRSAWLSYGNDMVNYRGIFAGEGCCKDYEEAQQLKPARCVFPKV